MVNYFEMVIYLILLVGIECLLYKYIDWVSMILGILMVFK